MNNAIVIGDEGVINDEGLRYPDASNYRIVGEDEGMFVPCQTIALQAAI